MDIHPVVLVLIVDVAATFAVFILSVITNNCSWYDPYWSVAPIPIAIYYTFAPTASEDVDIVRTVLVLVIICLWGGRLTYNFAFTESKTGGRLGIGT